LGLSFLFALLVPWLHVKANLSQSGVSPAPFLRVPLLGAPWSVSLFGVEILDPLAALGLFAAGAVSKPMLLGLLPSVLLVGLFGRYFCSWICPYAVMVGFTNWLRPALTRLGVPVADIKLPPRTAVWVLAGVVVVTALTANQVAPLVYPPALIGREAFRVASTGAVGLGALIVGAAVLFDTFVSRAGVCRSLCPGGALFRLMSFRSPVTVERTASKCTSCTLCDVVCNMGQSPMTDLVNAGCDRCGRCVSACPTDALELVAIGRPKHRRAVPPGAD
jgi:NapH/MauN family ferredoxin-type protein